MGYYIQTESNHNKAEAIAKKFNGEIVSRPATFSDIPIGKGLICIVDNILFEAAGFICDEREFNAFTQPSDARPHTWVLIDRADAERETNYP